MSTKTTTCFTLFVGCLLFTISKKNYSFGFTTIGSSTSVSNRNVMNIPSTAHDEASKLLERRDVPNIKSVLYNKKSGHPLISENDSVKREKILSRKATATFQNKNVIVTGATSGLGKAFALQLASSSTTPSRLILAGRNEDKLQTVVRECQEKAQNCAADAEPTMVVESVLCDLSNPLSVDKFCDDIRQGCHGSKIDVLINNGGISSRSNFVDTKSDVDEMVMRVNFLSGAALAKACVHTMLNSEKRSSSSRELGDMIIWISSVQGLVGIPSRTSYAASKFAVQGYCESLRAELSPSDISVHVVSPGYVRTNLSINAMTGSGISHGKMDANTENGADPNDVAVDVLERCSNGQTDIIVSAPFTARVAIWLRFLMPGILQKKLVKRFENEEAKKKNIQLPPPIKPSPVIHEYGSGI
eukprot:CAMPEP_0194355396 /NCGR_PEP_ID=MMETSP0174-20130528/3319_1 /TAXON_ID=216777 /ORGANISM="Proboscia alata, Strain PI-D3" /LENGTH=414 /DNA_ID=CAMNT_0039124659 /DNA_START=30 /DNA_END=1274 /DNA_ORIENTATION=+